MYPVILEVIDQSLDLGALTMLIVLGLGYVLSLGIAQQQSHRKVV
jgi:ABC-type spermidine/putrescine transport system permease subunit I